MTNEEAIKYLEQADLTVYKTPKTKTAEAIELAIQALEAQQRIRKIIDDFDNKHPEAIITSVHEYINDINDVIEDIEYQLPLKEGESE